MECEFSERQFELCFNYDFMNKYRHQLLNSGMPFVPSQNEEASLGYDVKHDFKVGRSAVSLMLQFKTSNFVRRRTRNNAHIYDCYNGAYFRFPIMKKYISKQHDIMVRLAIRGELIFYCSPLFYMRDELSAFFSSQAVMQNSRLFDPINMGPLPDNKQHHVSCDPSGQYGFFHSDNKEKIKAQKLEKIISMFKFKIFDENYLLDFKNGLLNAIENEYRKSIKIPYKFENASIIFKINYLLRMYVNVQWFLILLDN